jgi:hypothetical protein
MAFVQDGSLAVIRDNSLTFGMQSQLNSRIYCDGYIQSL